MFKQMTSSKTDLSFHSTLSNAIRSSYTIAHSILLLALALTLYGYKLQSALQQVYRIPKGADTLLELLFIGFIVAE
jgi:uncharacterized membrane protein YsdA (DUF1294 family)